MPSAPALRQQFLLWTSLTLFVVLLRVPVLFHPQPIDDEVVYSVAGAEIAATGDIYVSAIERKPPLLLYTYAAVAALGGPYNSYALHLVATGWIILTLAAVFSAARTLAGFRCGVVAAVLYALYQQWWYSGTSPSTARS